jgi:hypothetical protein
VQSGPKELLANNFSQGTASTISRIEEKSVKKSASPGLAMQDDADF